MKNPIKFFLLLALAAFCNIYSECAPEPVYANQPANTLEGNWETNYFEHNGMDVTQQYQMTLQFDGQGLCVQTLMKPGATLSDTLQYTENAEGTMATIGSANISISENEGNSVRLRYLNGAQPDGFIEPWVAYFRRE